MNELKLKPTFISSLNFAQTTKAWLNDVKYYSQSPLTLGINYLIQDFNESLEKSTLLLERAKLLESVDNGKFRELAFSESNSIAKRTDSAHEKVSVILVTDKEFGSFNVEDFFYNPPDDIENVDFDALSSVKKAYTEMPLENS